MTLEFHTWPPQWVADLCRRAESAMATHGGQLDPDDVDELLAAATELCGGDRPRGQELAAHVLALPQLEIRPATAPPAGPEVAASRHITPGEPGQSGQRQSHAEWMTSTAGPVRDAIDELAEEVTRQEAAQAAPPTATGDVGHELAALATSPSREIRAGVARNPHTPPHLLELLSHDAEERVRSAVPSARRRATAPSDGTRLLWLAEHEPPESPPAPGKSRSASHSQWSSSLWHESAPPEALAQLASHSSLWVRLVVARNPETPPAVLTSLAADGLNGVMQAVAGNPSTPPSTLGTLATNPKALLSRRKRRDRVSERFHLNAVRRAASANPSTPPQTLESLATEPRLAAALIGNPATPPDTLRALAEDVLARPGLHTVELDEARDAAAGNPAMPAEILHELGRRADPRLGRRLANNPNCPATVLGALAETSVQGSRHWSGTIDQRLFQRAIASNPGTPPAALDLLARSGVADVLGTVVAHPAATAAILAHVRSRLDSTNGA